MAEYLFHVDPPSVADEGKELAIQMRIRNRVKTVMPRVRLVAVPNGAQRTDWAALQAWKEGLSRGFPDLLAIWPGVTAYLEIKDKRGALTNDQIDWLNFLHQAGFPCGCFRSADTTVDFLLRAGAPSLTGIAA